MQLKSVPRREYPRIRKNKTICVDDRATRIKLQNLQQIMPVFQDVLIPTLCPKTITFKMIEMPDQIFYPISLESGVIHYFTPYIWLACKEGNNRQSSTIRPASKQALR